MKRRNFIQAAIAGTGSIFITPSVLVSGSTAFNGNSQPSNEGQRYLFLDDHWIAGQSEVERLFYVAAKEKGNPVIIKQKDVKGAGPYNFTWSSKQFPYSAWFTSFDPEDSSYPGYFFTSDDGINWSSICRRLTEGVLYFNNKSALYSDYPYLGAQFITRGYHWRFFRSRDGVRWEPFPNDTIWIGPSDVMQIQWDQRKEKFIAYFKVWRYKGTTIDGKPFVAYCPAGLDTTIEGNVCRLAGNTYLPTQTIDVQLEYGGDSSDDGGGGSSDAKMQMARVIGYAESSDFLHWENEQIILEPSPDAPLGDQSYGMYVYPYGNMYIGMYNHFNSVTGLLQPKLAWSYDGIHFMVHDQQFFIASGKADEWDFGMIVYPSDFMDEGNGQMYLYYGSLGVDHKEKDGKKYQGALGRAWLRQDGFASLKGGWIETVPLKIQSKQMRINMSGEIGVSLKSASGEAIGKAVLRGNYYNLIPNIDLSAWIDKDVIMHLNLSKGEVYSITI